MGFDIIEEPKHLRVQPKAHPMGCAVAWIVFVHLAIIGTVVYFNIWKKFPTYFALFWALLALEFPALLGILFAMYRAERAKGPLLEVDKAQRVLTLLRDDKKIGYDDIESVFVLVGWYQWTDWHEVAEMTLIVRSVDDHLESIPIVLHNDVRAVEDLAGRVAEMIGKPVRCTKLTWDDRHARSERRG